MPHYELHVGSADFWRRAREDISAARRRVLVQAMTFEGDSAGRPVAEAVAGSAAPDRRVLVDDYTRHVINDRFLAFSREAALATEAAATWTMFDELIASGVGVRVTNPIGRNPLRYPLRNHKKLLVMDDAAWIGGINFSDHNFAWHDMMLRIEDSAVADWLAGAFELDWQGELGGDRQSFGEALELLNLDGSANPAAFAPLLTLFAGARRSIELISAYPTFPFIDAMAEAAASGAAVTLYTPRPNNKPIVRDYLLHRAARAGFAVRLLPEMTHVKAALVDGETLVVGSSNFDFVSYRTAADYVATIREPGLIDVFEGELFAPARAASVVPAAQDFTGWRGARAAAALTLASAAVARLRHGNRVSEWQTRGARPRLAPPLPPG